jgi:hypothetical protein
MEEVLASCQVPVMHQAIRRALPTIERPQRRDALEGRQDRQGSGPRRRGENEETREREKERRREGELESRRVGEQENGRAGKRESSRLGD